MSTSNPPMVTPNPTAVATILAAVLPALLGSKHPAQRRQAHDIRQLIQLQDGLWRGRFGVLELGPGPRGAMAMRVRIESPGFVWNGRPLAHSIFDLALLINSNYPLAAPIALFTGGPVPYQGNVFDTNFGPDRRGMPPELQQVLREGYSGYCCYGLASQWRARRDYNLATVIRQISRLLVGAKIHGEAYSLNPQAQDFYLELKSDGRLPLGPALPLPCGLPETAEAQGAGAVVWRERKPETGDAKCD